VDGLTLNNYQEVKMAGKGDKPRDLIYTQEYRDNFDRIFGKKKPKETYKEEKKDDDKTADNG
jgi:dTDP-D-glucose 4,6-dehydratase